MKGIYAIIQCVSVPLLLLSSQQKGLTQCSVDYTTQNYFCDLDSLLLTAVPLSGQSPYSFIWETGETTQTIMIPLALGDYMLTMTDANGCTAIINCHIKPFPQVLYYPYAQDACEGDTATIFLQWFRDSIPGALYEWSTGETTPTITITDDLIWSVTITDPSNGCEFVIPENLFDFHPTPTPEIVGPSSVCNGETITLSVTGGPFGGIVWYEEGIWEGTWSETFEVTHAGTYVVWGSSVEAGYCWNQDTIVITEGNMPPPVLDGPPELCEGQSGTISVTNSAQYTTFNWSNGATTPSFTVNAPGTYTVTVSDGGGCDATESITVAQGTGPELTTDGTGTTCGENNGSIDLTAIPPQSLNYQWSNGATTPDLNNISAGSYTVTVTDLDGCTSTAMEIIPDNPIVITINANVIPNNSCTNFNGSIDIMVSPVNEPYTYSWSNGSTTEDLADLVPGNYTVTVSTGFNCNETASFLVDDISDAPEIISSVLPSSCSQNNGSITVQTNGGQPPFSYLWSNGNSTESLVDVLAGIYTITVTGANGCSSIESIILTNEDPEIAITGDILPNTSCTGGNGEIDVTVMPGGTYIYNWSNGSATEDIQNLNAGTYTLTVTLGATCIQTNSFTITNENIPFDIQGASQPNSSCTTPNGSIDLTILPSGSYSFSWSSGETTEDLLNLNSGIYHVTITDNSGCSISSSYTVSDLNSNFNISGITVSNTSCQIPNGMVDITVAPAASYSFLWSTGAQTEDLLNISAGTYSVTITNTDGCEVDTSFIVNEQSTGFTLSAIPQGNNSCTNPNGSIDLSITPTGAYYFLWSNGSTSEDLQFLGAGVYDVTVTDINSCSSIATFTISNNTSNPLISFSLIPEVCGAGNGSIDLFTTPAGNTYSWSNGAASEDLSNLSSGLYSVTVTGINGCVASDTFTISNNSNNFAISGTPVDNTSCSNPNGSINLTVSPAATYSIVWSNGATTEDIQNLAAGTYSVTVTDAVSCSSNSSFIIQSIVSPPLVSSIITNEVCGAGNGAIDLSTSPSGSSFVWSTGDTTEDLNDLSSGTYYITVTGTNRCLILDTFNVIDNSNNFTLSASSIDNASCTNPNGSINLSITPAGAYSFLWSNGTTTEDLQNLPAGTYTVTVTDNFNCSSSSTYVIQSNTPDPQVSEVITPASCGNANGSITININPPSGNTFQWSDGSSSKDIQNLLAGNYTVTVTASNGCTVTASFSVPDNNSNFAISSITTDEASCIQSNGSIDLTVTPVGTYTFIWSGGETTEDLANLASGLYEVTVTDHLNCSASEIFIIENITSPPFVSGILTNAKCGESNGRIDLTVMPSTGNAFLWSTGDQTEDLENLSAGSYNVTVTDLNGCTVKSNFELPGSTPIELQLDADISSVAQGGTVTCSLQINVPLSAIESIAWLPSNLMSCHELLCLEQTISIVEQTQISAMVMDTHGCFATASHLLDVNPEFKVFIPNVFSPNNDGPNDKFTVYANDEVEEVVILEIFDRWGNCVFINEVFPPNEPGYGWDGFFSGNMMNPAVYAYRAVVRYSNGEEHHFKGDVTLVR